MPACLVFRRRFISSSARSLQLSSPSYSSYQVGGARLFSSLHRRQGLSNQTHPPGPFSTSSVSVRDPKNASSFWAITATLVLIGGGTWLQDKYFKSPKDSHVASDHKETQYSHEPYLEVIDTLETMPVEAAPGTVTKLTPEQEAKLRDFWILTLKVFGVKLDELEQNGDAPSQSPAQDKKKKRFTMFGKSEDDDAASVSSANGVSSGIASLSLSDLTDGDDKYGQAKEFQQAIADISPEEIRQTFWSMVKHDHPDSLLLRFLRARKWDIKKALIMMISTMRWRMMDAKVDEDIMKNGEQLALKQSQSSDPAEKKAGEEFLLQMRMGKSFLHGVDKSGRPICTVRVRSHKASDQSVEVMERYTVYIIESARMLLAPPVETATIIFDMSDFSLSNMDYTPVKFMIKCFEANYPESLGAVLVHKAPWIFSGIWSIIKGWLDPVVAAKVHFTKNVQDLENFIPRDRIMKELGGDEDWEYKYVEPQPGENELMEDTATRDKMLAERQELAKDIQAATISWISANKKNNKEEISAAHEKRDTLIDQLRAQYWNLDPYLRARSLYDRQNVIQGGGKIEFYPSAEKKE